MKTIISISLFLITIQADALGTESSGGGGAFVCRSADRQLIDSELLDLWEGININELTIARSGEDINVQIDRAIDKLRKVSPDLADASATEVQKLRAEAKALKNTIGLTPPQDAFPEYQKPGCPLEGMMYYDGSLGRVVYVQAIYDALISETDRAAVWVHEGVYKVLREKFTHTNSRHSRLLVACLFANENCLTDGQRTIEQITASAKELYRCVNTVHEYYYFETKPGFVDFFFTKIDGKTHLNPPRYSTQIDWPPAGGTSTIGAELGPIYSQDLGRFGISMGGALEKWIYSDKSVLLWINSQWTDYPNGCQRVRATTPPRKSH